ncbi:MAG: hypothetical protein LBT22_06965 [Peptococcaceae bacterium]|jgi:hypothetical protein|nr:hypothetical protein [Peptococcaceae bacterium]
MLKLKIELDSEKILADGKYDASSIIEMVDTMFMNGKLEKDADGFYVGI